MRDLLRSLIGSLEDARDCLLCQVVETKGSTPQKAGALMLVRPDGGQVGTLGGGCVEAEVKQKAIRLLQRGGSELHSFVLDHDYAWADGLICGGKMVILAECIRPGPAIAYFRALLDLVEQGSGFTEAIAVQASTCGASTDGARFLFDAAGVFVAGWPDVEPPASLQGQVLPLETRPRPQVRGGVAWIPTLPRIRLIIVGAGHVGQAVADLAARSDFDVWVIDDRHQYANRERFPLAREIRVGPIEEVLTALDVDKQTYALIVTRGHGHDQEALFHLAPTPAPYVGLIGSRRKIRMIFDGLREMGIDDEALRRVAAPVGLEIGSESVTEIAVSIVAELIARRNLGPEGVRPRGWIPDTDDRTSSHAGRRSRTTGEALPT